MATGPEPSSSRSLGSSPVSRGFSGRGRSLKGRLAFSPTPGVSYETMDHGLIPVAARDFKVQFSSHPALHPDRRCF